MYREHANGVAGGATRYYASAAHHTDLAGLRPTTERLVEAGLPHLAQATGTFGHPDAASAGLTTIGLVAAFLVVLAATVAAAMAAANDLLWVSVPVSVVLLVVIAARSVLALAGIRGSSR